MHPKALLFEIGARARKSLSQNFLTSPHWAERLTHLTTQEPEPEAYWEIGPGLGALTEKLGERARKPVKVFEYDRMLAGYLREKFPQIEVIEGDFLEADLEAHLPAQGKVALLSNMPYHLSSPVLFKLLPYKERFSRLVLTFQKEFASRLYARPRTHDYGSLSVLIQLHFSIESVGVLPPGVFYPMPAVSSEAVLLEPKPALPDSLRAVNQVVKAAFKHRRKKVMSNLRLEYPKLPVEALLQEFKLTPSARPEELSKEQYLRLTEALGGL